jgi:RNA polymerase sigma factor (TIGR02999 family)
MGHDSRDGGEVTRLLASVRAGDRQALDELFPLVYDELRRLAGYQVRDGSGPATLQATGLVHEAYLKLVGSAGVDAESRAHFISIAGRAMRQVLVDRARAKGAQKRGGDQAPTTLHDGDLAVDVDPDDMLTLDQAIQELDPRQRRIVEARFFGGLEHFTCRLQSPRQIPMARAV